MGSCSDSAIGAQLVRTPLAGFCMTCPMFAKNAKQCCAWSHFHICFYIGDICFPSLFTFSSLLRFFLWAICNINVAKLSKFHILLGFLCQKGKSVSKSWWERLCVEFSKERINLGFLLHVNWQNLCCCLSNRLLNSDDQRETLEVINSKKLGLLFDVTPNYLAVCI